MRVVALILWTVLFGAAFYGLTQLAGQQWLACGPVEARTMRSCVFLVGNATFAAIGIGTLGWAIGIAWVLRVGRARAQNEQSPRARDTGQSRTLLAALAIAVWTVLLIAWLNGYVILGGLLDPLEIGCNLLPETVCNPGLYPFGHLAVYATALVWAAGILGIYRLLPVWRRAVQASQAW